MKNIMAVNKDACVKCVKIKIQKILQDEKRHSEYSILFAKKTNKDVKKKSVYCPPLF